MQCTITPLEEYTSLTAGSNPLLKGMWHKDEACHYLGTWGEIHGAEFGVNGFTISYYEASVNTVCRVLIEAAAAGTAIQLLESSRPIHTKRQVLQPGIPALVSIARPVTTELSPGFYTCYRLHMSASLFGKIAPAISGNRTATNHFVPLQKSDSRLSDSFRKIMFLLRQPTLEALPVYYQCLHIVKSFSMGWQKMKQQENWLTKKNLLLSDLKNQILESGPPSITPAFLRRYGLSRYQFNQLIKQMHHASWAAFVRQVRMTSAKDWVSASSLPLGTIAERLGYADFSSFSRAFKNFHGNTPSSYRKRKP